MSKVLTTLAVVLTATAGAHALTIMDTGSVSFSSDLQPNDVITVDSFDTSLGTLNSVQIDIWHDGSVTIQGDNDDEFNTADVQARMIRQFDIFGPGVGTSGARTINSPTQTLGLEDGDGGTFDAAAPDGYNFGILSYANWSAGSYFPGTALYETAGPGSVNFTVDPTAMVNDLNWVSAAPDQFQTEVQNPDLTVYVKVTYDYIPEPASALLLGLGGLALLRRRA